MEIYNLHLSHSKYCIFVNMEHQAIAWFSMIENWRARDERKFPPTIEFWRKDAFGGHIFRIMSCCPESSWPSLGAAGYQPKGNIEKVSFEILMDKIWRLALSSMWKVGDLSVYVVGSGPKTIVWNHDIFGWDSGRTRFFCDAQCRTLCNFL